MYRWRGINRRGTAAAGQTDCDPATMARWVRDRYRQGWRRLTVEAAGREAGGISPHPDTGHRIWWAETQAEEDSARQDSTGGRQPGDLPGADSSRTPGASQALLPGQTPPGMRPWPRCGTCGDLIQISTGRCVRCDFPPEPRWTFGTPL